MLQPEALIQASLLTSSSVTEYGKLCKQERKKKRKSKFLNLHFESCGTVMCAQGLFVRMQGVEMFNKTCISVTFLLFLYLSLWM